MNDPDVALERFDLDDEAKNLLIGHHYKGLVARGIHPILVIHHQRDIEWSLQISSSEPGAEHSA